MAKQGHQQAPAAVDPGDIVTKAQADATYYDFAPGHIDGFRILFNDVDLLDIEKGTCRDSTDTFNIVVPADLDCGMGNPPGAGGLDTGAEAASTWYAIYVIADTTGVASPAITYSASFVAPTLTGTYDVFRRIGAVKNNAASNFLAFIQRGKGRERDILNFNYNEPDWFVLNGGNAIANTTVDASSALPPTSFRFRLAQQFIPLAAGNQWRITCPDAGNFSFYGKADGTGDQDVWGQEIWTNSAQDFLYYVSNASCLLYLWVLGYTDEL